jgi:quercetin dioxygenase-like cupin family protein
MKITVIDAKTHPLQERMGRKIQVLFDDAAPDASQIQLMTVEYPTRVVATGNHSHESSQTIFVLEGVLTIEEDGAVHRVEAGSVINIPPGVPHRHSNYEDRPLRQLVIWILPAKRFARFARPNTVHRSGGQDGSGHTHRNRGRRCQKP